MHPAVAPLAAILELDTDLLINCIEGLSDTDARQRLAGGANSVVFLAVSERLLAAVAAVSAEEQVKPNAHPCMRGTSTAASA